ncbi:MAG: methyltransferase domain-containing protein, partial [Firmicutes bacterium]|nr:methyltransferase domain-containing protein [Bacillota bacterium]
SERTNLNGTVSIQGLSSQTAVKKLNPQPGEKILDLCAAPGGKAIYAAQLMNNTGEIIACDIYEHRVRLIEKEAERTGSTIIKTKLLDASKHNPKFDKSFDAVVCDVPCSGLGTIAKKPEIKLKDIDAIDEQLHHLYTLQAAILDNAASYIKDDGRIMYSTCTLNPNENELQIARFLDNHKDFEKEFTKTIYPKGEYDGFYIAILKRTV